MQFVTQLDYAKLRAASLFAGGHGQSIITNGIHVNKTMGTLEATNGSALIEIPHPDLGRHMRASTVIKPQGWFGPACSYVKVYQDGHEKTIGFMRGYTRSGTPIQKDGFDRLIPVVFIEGSFPAISNLKARFNGIQTPYSEISMDAELVSRVGQAVKLLTNGITTQVRMRFYGDPGNIRISDTKKKYCDVFLHAVRVQE